MRKITYWLTLVLIFIIPWEDSISVSDLGSLARLMGFAVAGFWVIVILLEGRFRRPHLFHAFILMFILWNAISVFWSPFTADTLQRVKTYIQIFLLMLIVWEMFQKPSDLTAGLQAYILGAFVAIASTIYNYLTGNVSVVYEGRYSASGVNAVDLALILILGLPIALELFFEAGKDGRSSIWKWINLAYIPLALFAILLTGSRTSLIAAVPFGLFIVLSSKITPRQKMVTFVSLLVTALVLLPFVPSALLDRLGTIGSSIGSKDLGGRVQLWLEAIDVFSRHPLTGIGGGALDPTIGSAAHNTFVSVLAETGSIGFILFLIILVTVFVHAMYIPNGNAGLWIAIFFTWAIGVCSISWEVKKLTWLLLNLIVIQGSFTYEQLHGQARAQIPKRVTRLLRPRPMGLK
jgi:O-antigen ligase